MKRVILGSLLSCMLVGQAFGADNVARNAFVLSVIPAMAFNAINESNFPHDKNAGSVAASWIGVLALAPMVGGYAWNFCSKNNTAEFVAKSSLGVLLSSAVASVGYYGLKKFFGVPC